jgi:hypothetical protein
MTITIPSSAVEAGAHADRLRNSKPIARTVATFLTLENMVSSLQLIE